MEKIDKKLYAELKELLNEIKADFGGGCSFEKGYMLAWLIANFNLRSTIDIGVYRGRSLFPQALAHKRFSKGVVYGVDPWDNELARENDDKELRKAIDDFLDKIDLNAISNDVNRFNVEKGFTEHCVLIRNKSEDAISQFRDWTVIFDLIHIDGNHDTEMVMKDIELYLPLLAEKGFIVLDDISWDSVRPALNAVSSKYSLIYKKTDFNHKNDFAIFWKNNNECEVAQIISTLEDIGNKFEINDLKEYLEDANLRIRKLEDYIGQSQEQIAITANLQSLVDGITHSKTYAVSLILQKIYVFLIPQNSWLDKTIRKRQKKTATN
jgi:hypothetical protein